jgi:DNA processing protein
MNTEKEKKCFHTLAMQTQGEYRALDKLRNTYGSWSNAYEKEGKNDNEKEWANLTSQNITLILYDDPTFPSVLKEIPWPPFALYVRGTLPEWNGAIGVVGTRKATPHGVETARKLGRELAAKGVAIISGLALGVDAAAHAGALEAGGTTIAVLAGGPNEIYPRQNQQLGEQIIENGGAIIAEYPPGSPSLPRRFIERNRIVSGLSHGIIVIEAPARSGALATARFAIEQNREVFVVPGGITQKNYEGSHNLIKEGASLITGSEDVLDTLPEEIQNAIGEERGKRQKNVSEEEQKIISALQSEGNASVDNIQKILKMDIISINRCLGALTVRGIVKEQSGKYCLI